MFFSSWLRNRTTTPRANRAAARRGFRPTLEALEDRWMPSTLTVTNTLDSGDGSLRADVTAAHKGDTIVFNIPKSDPGYNASTGVWTITLTSGELLIKQDLSITGPGASQLTISGDKLSRVFELSSKTKPQASLSGMTISNGDGQFGGIGGAINNNGTLTISNCTLSGNIGGGPGGAINNYGTLTISNSVLSDNSAREGGAISNLGPLTVNGCTLYGNSAVNGGDGGAISNQYSGVVTVSNCALSDNSAGGGEGGGIWIGAGTLNLSGCPLYGNSARDGGGIFAGGPSTLNISGCTLTDNSATQQGGGIFIYGNATVTVSGCVVGPATVGGILLPGNSAYQGGGIFVGSGTTLTVSGSVIGPAAVGVPGNSASQGGGIYVESDATVMVKNHSSITGNTAPAGSGADVYNLGSLYADSTSINSLGILNGNKPILI
jgi:parallel beta-helix repeat protein